jgi:hypothetical protein
MLISTEVLKQYSGADTLACQAISVFSDYSSVGPNGIQATETPQYLSPADVPGMLEYCW